MKKLMTLAAALLLIGVTSAQAAEGTTMGGLGFRSLNGPGSSLVNSGVSFGTSPAIGVRQWFSEKVGVDLAIGFTSLSLEAGTPSVKVDEGTGVAVDIGIPIVASKMDKVMFIFRPGFQYGQATAKDKLPVPAGSPTEFKTTSVSVSGELEVEFMLTDKLSVSAAHGIAYRSIKVKDNATPVSEGKVTGFETTGDNFTQLGFHVYLW